MVKILGRVFFVLSLVGFLGALSWSGYLYHQIWLLRDRAAQAELGLLRESLAKALAEGGWQNARVLGILSEVLASLRHYRFLSLSTEDGRIAHFVAQARYKIPSDLAARPFPGFTAVPFVHHVPHLTIEASGASYLLAGWRDPVWTLSDLRPWLYPGIALATTFMLGLLFMLILASRGRAQRQTEDALDDHSALRTYDSHPPETPKKHRKTFFTPPLTLGDSPPGSRLFDPDDFVWEDIFDLRLATEIDRSAADNQDLSLVLCSLENTSDWPRAVQSGIGTLTPYRDMVFKWGEGFAVILPKTSLDEALEETQDFLRHLRLSLPGSRPRVGISARCGRLLSVSTLVNEAQEALSKTGFGRDNVVGFRADPQLYREFLAKTEGRQDEG